MVTIEYRVQPEKRAEFVAAMREVREMRRRNGAFFWELFHEAAEPTRYVETFMDESWVEHLRQHERASVADRNILNARRRSWSWGPIRSRRTGSAIASSNPSRDDNRDTKPAIRDPAQRKPRWQPEDSPGAARRLTSRRACRPASTGPTTSRCCRWA